MLDERRLFVAAASEDNVDECDKSTTGGHGRGGGLGRSIGAGDEGELELAVAVEVVP